ncbi:hypothetical protein [Streptomyces syringium]|uniref:hypothetical protein n=1 Tax=Streptomyces syringium TaxID=76729 RepID=UPI003407BA39
MSEQTDDGRTNETARHADPGTAAGPAVPEQRHRLLLPSEIPGHHAKVDFPPVENGVDYLVSVADHLAGDDVPLPRDIKYAVLHLQAAAEVLLKARLQREHWSLVFKDPGTATRAAFEKGDFESCTTENAVVRLRNIADLRIDDKAAADLKSLAKSRNALQHYGLTAPARAVEARAASVLDFLLAFVYDQLLPQLTRDEAAGIRLHLDGVAETVRGLQSFLTKRRNRLKGELKDLQHHTVQCPSCGEWAMLLGEGNSPNCLFCHASWDDATDAAADYVIDFEIKTADLWTCPECAVTALIYGQARIAAAPGETLSLCFACGTSFEDLTSCESCTELTPQDDSGMCHDCLAARFAKF